MCVLVRVFAAHHATKKTLITFQPHQVSVENNITARERTGVLGWDGGRRREAEAGGGFLHDH